jgi:hypothetical protein
MERKAREQQARINSPHCQELAKRQKEAAGLECGIAIAAQPVK